MTEKKNQHYIPKFYLRNFSYQKNKKQIGVLNIYNSLYIQRAKLKTQGSRKFFYGYDGIIEDNLANVEGFLSQAINEIIDKKQVPKKNSERHLELLSFVTLTDLRNPIKVEGFKNQMKEMKKNLLELDPQVDVEIFVPNPTHEEIIQLLLSNSVEMINYISDLEFKLLINNSDKPFISSDFPVVKYNQFLENAKWKLSKSGYGTVGLQIFIPLNSELTIVFFDPGIYKVGDKKKKYLELSNSSDIDAMNTLQFINCFETIYFDEKAYEEYIRKIEANSKKFKRANVTHSSLSHLIKEGENEDEILKGKQNLMVFGSTDCEMKLQISGIKIHDNGKNYKFDSSAAQLRKHCKALR
jgi:hypothetical protein